MKPQIPPSQRSLLDPADWVEFRLEAHRLLDLCVDHLAQARERPWRPVEEHARRALALGDARSGSGVAPLVEALANDVMPYSTGNTHPRFFGWVHGTGLASGLLADMVASTMNSNCGGRDHGAVYVEREVIAWCRQCFGFPAEASGVLVTGTSQATVIALAVARQRALGAATRRDGIIGGPRLRAYATTGVHSAISKALELLGLGSASLRTIRSRPDGGMDTLALEEALAADRAEGRLPFCVIGTAGSVDLGEFDDLDALATLCARENLWFHVDGAFGSWVRLAESPWCELARGIDRADSLAFDFHKWMYLQYDCGAVLVRDETLHRAAFASRPDYLAVQEQGLGGGGPWFCDYGVDLSRGFRALKVWSALRVHGADAFGQAITRNCQLARLMAERVKVTPGLRLAREVKLNVCCFRAVPAGCDEARLDALNSTIAQRLQLSGEVVFSTTRVEGRTVLRAAIVNHRTTEADIELAIEAVAAMVQSQASPAK